MARPYVKPREWPNKDGSKGRSWEVKYQDLNGRRRSEGGFKTKKAAEVRATEIGHELALGTFTPESETITVKEAGDQWMQKRELAGCGKRSRLWSRYWV
jgi:integrase